MSTWIIFQTSGLKTIKTWTQLMYGQVNSGNEITIIWCEGRSHEHSTSEPPSKNMHKRKATESDRAPPTKQADKIDQLALELHDLEKHGEAYSMLYLHTWARMILNKQHKSKDVPPPFPLFKEHAPKHPQKRDNLADALTSAAIAVIGMIKGPCK